MKFTLFLSSLWLLIASFFVPAEKTLLTGTVRDQSGEALIGASVRVLQNRTLVKATVTDIKGQYRFELDPGTYQVEFAYTGFTTQRIAEVLVNERKESRVDVKLESGATLSEVVVTSHGLKDESDDWTMGAAPSVASRHKERSKSAESERTPAAMAPKPVLMDIKEFSAESAYEEKGRPAEEIPGIRVPGQPAPRAGLLTAGEWNDLHNWNRHWVDLLADGETDAFQKMYGFFPRQRFTVMLTNEHGFPIADAVAQLKTTEGKMLWEARTDNTGKAELWAALFNPEKENTRFRAEIWQAGIMHEILALKAASEGFNYLKINAECKSPKNVDIVWAVDATGSMGDEIEYLKTELLDVIGRAKSYNPELSYRMGTVFYRDKGDEYLTKSSGLSSDIPKTVEFIQKQFAGGGGDYPEAVHSALEEAIFSQKWSENAVARICFLVLDASPHQGADINESLQKSIREAARLGIRIVPIAASGIQKDTEFLMKFFGLATNGSYVFLTDHSGIGGKHLEPTTDEYKVEPLNHLLVRLITEYTTVETCAGKSEIRFENDPQQQPGPLLQALYYPNPAVDQFTLELPFAVQSVTIYDSEGKAVRKLENPAEGPNVMRVHDLAAGFYTIRILHKGLMQSGKLMVVRS